MRHLIITLIFVLFVSCSKGKVCEEGHVLRCEIKDYLQGEWDMVLEYHVFEDTLFAIAQKNDYVRVSQDSIFYEYEAKDIGSDIVRLYRKGILNLRISNDANSYEILVGTKTSIGWYIEHIDIDNFITHSSKYSEGEECHENIGSLIVGDSLRCNIKKWVRRR